MMRCLRSISFGKVIENGYILLKVGFVQRIVLNKNPLVFYFGCSIINKDVNELSGRGLHILSFSKAGVKAPVYERLQVLCIGLKYEQARVSP